MSLNDMLEIRDVVSLLLGEALHSMLEKHNSVRFLTTNSLIIYSPCSSNYQQAVVISMVIVH